ncbi:unnamed protein product (macronuclear) [Paramecium tetraurelia]|uniref:Uncharacterized protein n=1 Tax=Paramecium tetraurelia TaxID=5888 RepID=A0E9U3_PARTE|nr:uncharacterized protein GSPATT00024791001 [Paramecium tetraurelia]CAK92060.1 unnamed protein product [Paramecium tetraurelia]|eukprot:XP_001459457.1 hypothetical protein (macronuclear) [Paramecium tetraurelia strain d4-2]
MSEQQSKGESQENSSLLSSQEEQQKKYVKPVELINFSKGSSQSLIINEQTSTREERKMKQYLQRIQEKERQEEAATLKRKRSKPNPPLKQQDSQEQPTSSENKEEEGKQTISVFIKSIFSYGCVVKSIVSPLIKCTIIRVTIFINKVETEPKIKNESMTFCIYNKKEQHHIYLYLSDCQDRSFDTMQKLQASATQLYSPQKQTKDQTSLNQINQEIFQETSYLIKNIKNQYQQYIEPIQTIGLNDQKEFYNKYFDKKYVESVIRESKLQIHKKSQLEKQTSIGKQIPKKH